jgi:pSer/pThr/pTyr-binding forkhead associated (FHA) protein
MKPGKTDLTISSDIRVACRDRELRPHFLDQSEGEGAPRRITLDQGQMVLGRDELAAIRLPTKSASRQHACLTRNGMEYTVRDNDSRNGVYLNGVRIHAAVLRDGDILQVADCVFTYHEG